MKINNNLLSIIIPVYNRFFELTRALNSLKVQTNSNFNVIVIDDGSTVDLFSIVKEFKSDLNIVYHRIDNSGGPSRPRNMGIDFAKTEWVSFLDSDDWYLPTRVETVLSLIESKNDSIDCICHKLSVYPQKIFFWKKNTVGIRFKNVSAFRFLSSGNPVANSSLSIKVSTLKKIEPYNEDRKLKAYEDFDLVLRLIEINAKFFFINKVLGYYSLGNDNISKNASEQLHVNTFFFNKHISKYRGIKRFFIQRFQYYNHALISFQLLEYKESLKYSLLAFPQISILRNLKLIYLILKYAFFSFNRS